MCSSDIEEIFFAVAFSKRKNKLNANVYALHEDPGRTMDWRHPGIKKREVRAKLKKRRERKKKRITRMLNDVDGYPHRSLSHAQHRFKHMLVRRAETDANTKK